jgi:hypothetical protein
MTQSTAPTATSIIAPATTVADILSIAADLKAVYPDRARRVEKAVQLVRFRSIERGDSGRVWWVGSETTPDTTYAVADATCQCMDYQKRGGPCAHQLAVTLVTRLERIEADREAPAEGDEPAADEPCGYWLTDAALELLGELPDLTPQCPRCHAEPALPSHVDHLGARCLSAELFGDDSPAA